MLSLDFGDTSGVHGDQYCVNLYTLAKGCDAGRVLEIGVGWGFSAASFATAMRTNNPIELVSVDPTQSRVTEQNERVVLDSGIKWTRVESKSCDHVVDSLFDIVYIDGDPDEALNDARKYLANVRPGGYLVLDGIGGQYGPTHAYEVLGVPFQTMRYSRFYSHAVHQVAGLSPMSDSISFLSCDKCGIEKARVKWRDESIEVKRHFADTGHGLVSMNPTTGIKMAWREHA